MRLSRFSLLGLPIAIVLLNGGAIAASPADRGRLAIDSGGLPPTPAMLNSASRSRLQLASSPPRKIGSGKRDSTEGAVSTSHPAPTFWATPGIAGFSADGNHFIYLESSRDTGAGIPRSMLQIVEVATNSCVTGGCLETQYQEADANRSLIESEASLLRKSLLLRRSLNLTTLTRGERAAILNRSRSANGLETVSVQLPNDQRLELRLVQQVLSSGDSRAAMQIEASYDDKTQVLSSLENYRDRVLEYSIREVWYLPERQQVVVLITAIQPTFEGTLGTTLVQGFRL